VENFSRDILSSSTEITVFVPIPETNLPRPSICTHALLRRERINEPLSPVRRTREGVPVAANDGREILSRFKPSPSPSPSALHKNGVFSYYASRMDSLPASPAVRVFV